MNSRQSAALPQQVRRYARSALLVVAAALLGACASQHGIAPQRTPTPDAAWAQKLGLREATAAASEPSATWWNAYNDPQLAHWIELALADSPSLRQADERLTQARAAVEAAAAAFGPSIGFQASSVSQRFSENGIYPPPLGGMVHTINDADLTAALELDAFGRLAAREDGAALAARAIAADRAAARVQLAAAVAQAYFQIARAERARDLARDTQQQRTQILDLVQRRVDAGLDTLVEQRQAEGAIPQIRVDLEVAEEQLALARHALAVLAGQPPQAADAVDAALPKTGALAPPAALPIDLLARRADVAAAQLRIRAALREVDAARADFYPNINLSALVGLDSLTTQSLFKYSSRTWAIGPAVHLPLFESGRLRAQLRSDSAAADAAIDAYDATVLEAAHQASDTLASIAAVGRQREQQQLATDAAQSAYDLALIRYRAGLGTYLTVLTAETSVLAQRRAQLDFDARSANLDVELARALGGGFRAADAALAAR